MNNEKTSTNNETENKFVFRKELIPIVVGIIGFAANDIYKYGSKYLAHKIKYNMYEESKQRLVMWSENLLKSDFFDIEEKSIQSIKKIHTEVLLYFKNTKPVSIEELEDCTNLLESLNNIILDAMLIYESMEDKSNVNEDFVKCLNLYIKTFEKRKSSLQYKITLN